MPDHMKDPEVIVMDIIDIIVNEGSDSDKISDIKERIKNGGYDDVLPD